MENKVIYQIYPKSFKDSNGDGFGDIQGIIEQFDYIKNLGADYIWLTPILKSPQNDNGYDISDYTQVDQIFGTLDDYYQLVKIAKKNDIKIMFDLVLNHVSTEHQWFKAALEGNQYYYDFFVWSDQPNQLQSGFGTSAWSYCPVVGKYYLHLFDKTQADLNWHNPNVRQELYKMINNWISIGVEGFRLDVIDLIAKEPEKMITSRGPKFHEYLSELVKSTFKDELLTVGECWNFGPEDTEDITTENGLTQVFHFSHLDWIYPKWGTPKISAARLAEIMNKWQQNHNVIEALVLNNHDIPRLQSYWYGPSENQIDNYYKCTMLFAINLLSSGNTYIYQGEEIGVENAYNFKLSDYNDIESINKINEMRTEKIADEDILKLLHKVSRDNARTPIKWNATRGYGFSKCSPWISYNQSDVNVELDLNSDFSIYKQYQKMIKWKKVNYNLLTEYNASAIENYLIIETKGYYGYINLSENEYNLDLKESDRVVLGNYPHQSNVLRGYEFIILKK